MFYQKQPIKISLIVVVLASLCTKISAQSIASTDSVTVSIAPGYNAVSKSHLFWFGKSYRKLWAVPVKLKKFELNKEKGGLVILQKGGGLQTKSLRLRDSTGQEWVLRTIQKYPENGLPEYLRATVVKDILQDQVATAHPFASLTVPVFCEALDIPHSSPQIVYVPADTALKEYITDFGSAVFLFEEREPIGTNTDNTARLKKQLRKDNDNSVDQKLVLRARLLDILLGDWDRHEDQWRWQHNAHGNGKLYKPVPRDRDQVFYNTSGVFAWFVSHQWLMSKFQGFHDRLRDINGFNFNARYFDRYFLNSLDEKDWKEQASYLQQHLTDSVLNEAIHWMPDTVFALSGEKILRTLKTRLAALPAEAINYYHFLSQTVEVPASDKHELFEIYYTDQGNIELEVFKTKKDGTKDRAVFKREFVKGITKEIRLYGFDGRDIFSVTGTGRSPIKVRMIGGADLDSFFVSAGTRNQSKLFVYDRRGEANAMPLKGRAKIRVSGDIDVNDYNDQAFKYNRSGPLVLGSYTIDHGILIKLGYLHERQGFRKEPYAQKQLIMASYATARKSFIFDYEGDFKKVIRNNDLNANLVVRGPNNTGNFFGIGNETEFVNKGDQKMDYYRCRYDLINADIALRHPLSRRTAVYGGIAGQYYTAAASENENRFLDKFNAQYPDEMVYGNKKYAGVIAGFVFDSRNDNAIPTKGFLWNVSLSALKEIGGLKQGYGKFTTDISCYAGVGKNNNLVIANRIATGTTTGNPAFFQLPGIGGAQSMRGFHTNRFLGKSNFYHNLELRLKLFDFNSYLLPGTVGLIGFNDFGRVWASGEQSGQWHDAYGGGIYLIPARLMIIQAVFGFSKEGVLPYVTLGFRF